jgi:WD40 repeat protein/serine/threonine protein kinase/tetratricopeptide (TPR) repeat protein
MPDSIPTPLSEAGPAAQLFVRQALRSLEADLRQVALLTLGDWAALGIAVPALFRALANLQRPSWGHWNGLLTALREARKATLGEGTPEQREAVRQAAVLNQVLDGLDAEADRALVAALIPLADLVRTRLGRRPSLDRILALPITLRNEVIHFQPDDPAWWERAAEGLRPLVAWLAGGGLRVSAAGPAAFREPWFLPGTRAVLNGFDDDTVHYASDSGTPIAARDQVQPLRAALRRLLGQEHVEDESLRKLLARAAPAALTGVLLGDFLVRGPAVGRGGFAAVFAAVQIATGRQVAVKILHDGPDDDTRARFQQEARFLSQFNHPNIVRVIGRGEEPWFPPRDPALARGLAAQPWFEEFARGRPTRCYLALEWVEGHTLEQVFQGQRPRAPDCRELTRWFAQSAGALAAVHGAGLIHRDIKPGNLMVGEGGTVTLMDFGIARIQDERRTIQTTPGRVLGTPAYLAPEQLEARNLGAAADQASDVYALCATFYELYTGRRLFGHDRATEQAVNTRKLSEPHPDRPRQLTRDLPWEVDAVLLGGLQREPTARYRSATNLERDLHHVLRDEPIEYRRPSAGRRFRLWWRRNPRVARLTVTVAALLVVLAGGSLAAALLINESREQERTARGEAETSAGKEKTAREAAERSDKEGTRRLVRLLVADGWRAFGEGDCLTAVPLFVQALEAGRFNPRAEANHRLRVAATLRRSPRLTQVWFHAGPVHGADFSPDGRLVVTASADGTARVWDVATGSAVGKPICQEGGFSGAVFSPDGKLILTWSPYTERTPWRVFLALQAVASLGAAPSGPGAHGWPQAVVAWGAASTVASTVVLSKIPMTPGGARVWDAATGEPRGPVMRAGAHIGEASFSSDGGYVTVNRNGDQSVHDPTTGKPVRLPGAGEARWLHVLFAPRSRRVLTVYRQKDHFETRAWDLDTGKPVGPPLPAAPHGIDQRLRLDDDGNRVLSLGFHSDGARVWDLVTGRPVGPMIQHGRGIVAAALSPDGKRVVTVAGPESWSNGTRPLKPGEAQVWEVETGQPVGSAFHHDGDIQSAFFAAGGEQVVTVGETEARVWDVASGQPLTPPLRHRHGLAGVRVSPDARRVLTWDWDGSVRLWDMAVTDLLRGIPDAFTDNVEVGPDGKRVLLGSRIWDADTTQPLTECRMERFEIHKTTLSPDGRLVALGGRPFMTGAPTAYVCDTERGKMVAGPLAHEAKSLSGEVDTKFTTLAFHPDGQHLATGASDGTVRLWDALTGKPLSEPLRHQFEVKSVAFSADGTRLLTVAKQASAFGTGGEARLWDVATGAEIAGPFEHAQMLRFAVLSRDGKRLLVGAGKVWGPGKTATGAPDVVEVREVASGAIVGKPMPQPGELVTVTFSPDGHRVLAACTNGSARVYEAETGTPVTPVLSHPAQIRQASFSRDGRLVLCCCGDDFGAMRIGELRVWDAETGEMVAPPMRHLLSVKAFALTPDEQVLVAAGRDFVRFWDLSAEQRPAEDLRLLARLVSETEVDEGGHPSTLNPADYRTAWERYQARNPSADRSPRDEQVVAWHAREAIYAEKASQWRSAARHLDALLQSGPRDEQLHARRGYASFHLEAWKDAVASFSRSLELGNKDWNVRYHRGLALAKQRAWADAIRDYDIVLKEIQLEWEVFYHRGVAHLQLGQYARAEADGTEAIEALGGKWRGLSAFGIEHQARTQRLGGEGRPWFLRGLARHDSGQFKLAIEDYNCTLEATPKHLWALSNRGDCRRAIGEYDVALQDYDAAVKGGLTDWRPWAGRGWIEAHRGRWPQAGAAYTEAFRHEPEYSHIWLEAALLWLRLRDRDGYRVLCAAMSKRAAGLDPGWRLRTALTCAAADGVTDWSELRRWCDEATEKKATNSALVRGAVLYRQGRFKECRQSLQQAAQGPAGAAPAAARLLLAMAWQRDGKEQEAAVELAAGVKAAQAATATAAWTDRLLLELLRNEAEQLRGSQDKGRP